MCPPVFKRGNMDKKNILKRKTKKYSAEDYENGAFFVTICTRNRERLFGEIQYSEAEGATLCGRPHNPHIMIIKWMLELEYKYPGVIIDHFVVMPDHIHFVVFLPGGHSGPPLSDVVRWFKTMTTNEYIRNVKKGLYPAFEKAIWQRGYFAEKISSEQMLYSIRTYIEENPIKWHFDKQN